VSENITLLEIGNQLFLNKNLFLTGKLLVFRVCDVVHKPGFRGPFRQKTGKVSENITVSARIPEPTRH
jgi:hypothetical protein